MAAPLATRPPEISGSVTTSWLPMTTAWPSTSGCASSFWQFVPQTLAAWDPGYGIFVQPGLLCQPPEVTSWWEQNHSTNIDTTATTYSLGPVVCPEGYFTASTSVNPASSTLVGCCPSGYTMVGFFGAGDTQECSSAMSVGQVIEYATEISSTWVTSTSTISTSSVAWGIPVNGWLFPVSATPTPTPTAASPPSPAASTSAPTTKFTAPPGASQSPGLSKGAIGGIAAGAVLGAVAIFAALLALFLRRRASRLDKLASLPPMARADGELLSFPKGPGREIHYELPVGRNPAELPGGSL